MKSPSKRGEKRNLLEDGAASAELMMRLRHRLLDGLGHHVVPSLEALTEAARIALELMFPLESASKGLKEAAPEPFEGQGQPAPASVDRRRSDNKHLLQILCTIT